MKQLIFTLLIGSGLFFQGCVSTKPRFAKQRNFQTFQQLNLAIEEGNKLYDARMKDFSRYAKVHQHNQKSDEKLSNNARLGQRLGHVTDDILLIRNALQINDTVRGKPFTVEEFLKPENKHYSVPWLKKQFDEYIRLLLERVPQKYIADTTSWSRRYIKQLPPEQQKNPPSFAEFYFKGASQEEALVVLSTLQLGILQEALEIQEKILKE